MYFKISWNFQETYVDVLVLFYETLFSWWSGYYKCSPTILCDPPLDSVCSCFQQLTPMTFFGGRLECFLSLSHTGRELEAPQAALSQWLTCAGVPKALLPCPRVRTSSKIETEMGSKKFYFLFVTDQPYTKNISNYPL